MSLDPTLFNSTNLETANETVLCLYETLRASGLKTETARLRGLLPMVNAELARVVQSELVYIRNAARERKDEKVLEAVATAIAAVRLALSEPQFLQAS